MHAILAEHLIFSIRGTAHITGLETTQARVTTMEFHPPATEQVGLNNSLTDPALSDVTGILESQTVEN